MEYGLPATISLPISLRILSQTPERIRVRLPDDCREPDVMEQIVQALQQVVPQIRQTKINPQTGSLTLYLDPGSATGAELLGPLEALGLIAIASESSELPSASRQLTGLMASWNQRVNQWTEGSADLRFLVPMTFAILAFRRFVMNGSGLKSAPWYILAWYAFDSFMKLNSPQNSPPEPTTSKPGAATATPQPPTDASTETFAKPMPLSPLPDAPLPDPVEANHHRRSPKPRSKKSAPST